MAELDEQREQRLAKLARLRARGIDPYPHRFHRTNTAAEVRGIYELLEEAPPEELADSLLTPEVGVAGRLVAIRGMGKATFAHIQDGTGRLQIYFRRDVLGDEKYAELKEYDLGDFVGVQGRLFRTKTGEITVEAADFAMLAKALRPPPEKWHGITDVEKRYRQRYLDLIANADVRRTFALRSQIVAKVRQFLNGRDFLEVETPVLHPTVGGAAARPFVTFHNSLDRHLFLRISLELHLKRVLIGGFEKVYEIGRVFRNEGLSTKHNPEFTMLESYQAYADYHDVMRMVEELVSFVAGEVLGTTKIVYAGQPIDLTPPWPRLTLRDAIREHSGIDFFEYPNLDALRGAAEEAGIVLAPYVGRGKIIDELLTAFVEPKLMQPTFLIDYPVELSPLAKKKEDDPRLVERFEAFIAGMEVANAFSELNDPVDQRERFEAQVALRVAGDEEAELLDDDFLVALEHGMPPAGGLGIGIDRLVMLLTDQQSIREVILFPALRRRDDATP